MSGRALQFTIFLSILLSLISFWDHPILSYTKEFVVLVHEICHAVAALITGGDVKNIVIHGNESGETIAIPPNVKGAFLFIVSAGYLGTAFIGGILLYKGFQGENTKTTLILFGIVVFFITMKYSKAGDLTYNIGIAWSVGILVSAFLGKRIASLILVFLGTSISLYSIYDLSDFSNQVQQTDAGILAYHLTGYNPNSGDSIPPSVMILGHLIAITWSLISIGTIYNFLIRSIHHAHGGQEVHTYPTEGQMREFGGFGDFANPETQQMFPGELTPEVIDWFLSKGLDLNGNPLEDMNRELVDGIQKDSEMS
ncbi:MAG: M50 family metallopeptidase [Leptospira sp.]|nr:M50 family metallopeptidase [Leptospira sp.]